ncbi:holo-ACP synthase [Salinispirillum sp. LH 10-3-1]|uniref:Holo-[acyl-carrier-protein] synthase n=1 Tax=Salinispirillum sp. LH 10-3-1 TaxID=2952525 RepID=A0AB38YDL3_9GAMM
MIVGIGTDIVRIARIKDALNRHGDRMAQRILTPAEQALLRDHSDPARFLAKRWAAKEAAAKALGTGIRGAVNFHCFEVQNDDLGKPELTCSAGAAERLANLGGASCWLTLSDEEEYAVAFVVLSA